METVYPFEPGPDNRAALAELERRFAAGAAGCDPAVAGLYVVAPPDPYQMYASANGA